MFLYLKSLAAFEVKALYPAWAKLKIYYPEFVDAV
jgi:hypothetical protein